MRLAKSHALALAGFLLANVVPPPECSAAPDEEVGVGTEWNQWGGNPGRTFAVDVEPCRTAPRERWRRPLQGVPGDPVCSGGVVFVPVTSGGKAHLRAFSAADGKQLGSRNLGDSGTAPPRLAVWQGTVIIADAQGLRGFRHRNESISPSWTFSALPASAPALLGDAVFVSCGGYVKVVAADTGQPREFRSLSTWASPAFRVESALPPTLGAVSCGRDYGTGWNVASVLLAPDRGEGTVGSIDAGAVDFIPRRPPEFLLARIPRTSAATEEGIGGWLLLAPRPTSFLGEKKLTFRSAVVPDARRKDATGGLCPIETVPTVFEGHAYGFGPKGDLLAIRPSGEYLRIVDREHLPPGATPGPATRARGVAYFGNWALDLAPRRVLWCDPAMDGAFACIPVADRAFVKVTARGELVGYVEATAAPAGAPPGAPAPTATVPPAPTDVEAGARPRTPESAMLDRWEAHLHGRTFQAFEEWVEILAKEDLLRPCAALVEEARAFGMPRDRADALARRVAGKKENPFAERRLAAVGPVLARKRAELRDAFLAASSWCRDRGFPATGACLLEDAHRLLPLEEWDHTVRTRDLVPPAYPWKDRPLDWPSWARALVRADGEFVPPEDPLARSIQRGPWADAATVIRIRSPHLVFRTTCPDPDVAGRCLVYGEWTLRCLGELLGPGALRPIRGDGDRLDVRVHGSRVAYLAEEGEAGFPLPWSAGYYVPAAGVSRFYVPGSGEPDPLGRGLFQVLSHELTHHVVDRCWTARRSTGTEYFESPGYWCVEGFARFVEQQVVEMDRRGLRFDDPTVSSVEATALLEARGGIFPPSALLEMDYEAFMEIDDESEPLKVGLRHTSATLLLDRRAVFYEQSGATVYFLVNERGPEGRRAFFDYLARYYSGEGPTPVCKALGFADGAEFDAAFRAFLAKHR